MTNLNETDVQAVVKKSEKALLFDEPVVYQTEKK
jgi:hypothetical protein